MSTQTYLGTLVVKACPTCGITYGVPREFNERKHDDSTSWYCPNGHSLHYIKSTETKLRAELDQMKADRDWWTKQAAARDEAVEAERRRHAATKGQLTKTKKRATAGLCPCCSRSFVDVRRHMASKHPGEAVAGLGDGKANA